MKVGERIAQGRTAEIFAYGDGWVLKLFRAGRSVQEVEHEAKIARVAHAAGVGPAVREIVSHEGRWGLAMEHVVGQPMMTVMTQRPWQIVRHARMLAELHATIHQRIVSELPSQRERLIRLIKTAEISAHNKDRALQRLEQLPDERRLCHGDFHPDNVIVTARGALVIDWSNATRGQPCADVMWTSLLSRVAEIPPYMKLRWLIQLMRGVFHRLYLQRYFELQPALRAQFMDWQLPVAIARLHDDVAAEKASLLKLIERSAAES